MDANQQVIERQTNDNLEYGKEYAGLIKISYQNLMLDKRVLKAKERLEKAHIISTIRHYPIIGCGYNNHKSWNICYAYHGCC